MPFYEQVAEQVPRLIRENNLRPGQTFYSEAVLAQQLGISKIPIRHGFQKLRSEGFLLAKKGKASVIGKISLPRGDRYAASVVSARAAQKPSSQGS